MPVKNCRSKNKPGYKWGDSGTCYTYTPGDEKGKKAAKAKARKQGAAIKANQISLCIKHVNGMIKLEPEDTDWAEIRDSIYKKTREFIEELQGEKEE